MTIQPEQPSTLIMLTHDGMGSGDALLQRKLIAKYLQILLDDGKLPGAIAFFTNGVKLVCDGSPVLDQFRALEAKGVNLIVCKTCLDHYGLLEQARVGLIGGMGDIIEAQWRAEKVITL